MIDSPIDIIVGRPDIRHHNLLRRCHDQILFDTKVRNINDPSLSPINYLDNELWLRINIICTLGEDNNMASESKDLDEEPSSSRRQFDPLEWHALRSTLAEQSHIVTNEHKCSSQTEAHSDLNENECIHSSSVDNSGLLGLISDANRSRKPNPPIKPLPYAVETGDIIHMDQLLDKSSDGFDPANMINHPDDDPMVSHNVNTSVH